MTSYRKSFISFDNRNEPDNEWVWSIFAIDYSAFEMPTEENDMRYEKTDNICERFHPECYVIQR